MSVTATPNPYQNELQQVGQALHFLPKITNNGNGGGGGNRTNMMNDEASNSMNVNVRTLSRVGSIGSNHDRYRYNINNNNESSMSFNNIPEGIRTMYTPDVNKVTMPIFGSRPGSCMSTNDGYIKNNSFGSQHQQQQQQFNKIDIDEYYNLLKEKLKNNNQEIKTKFRNADPDGGKGGITKEALAHCIASLLGPSKPLSHQHYIKLMEKLGLKNRIIIKYEEFVSSLLGNGANGSNGERAESAASEWVDPVRNSSRLLGGGGNNLFRKANQAYVILKDKTHLKTNEMISLIPQLNNGAVKKIFKPELLHALNSMSIKMEPEEFEKLWKKFDIDNTGFVKSDLFLKRLGLSSESMNNNDENSDSIHTFKSVGSNNNDDTNSGNIPYANISELKLTPLNNRTNLRKTNAQTLNPMEKWLKKRFRNGFTKLKSSFEEIDRQRTGQVRRDQFLQILRQHGLVLEQNLLDAFLDRCNVKTASNSNLIPYIEFLEKFQNRSDQGLAYKIISGEQPDGRSSSNMGHVERKLLSMFQNDFLGLLQIFRKIDRNRSNTISKQEFRAALESHFSIELTDLEYEEFFKSMPKDNMDRIKYLEFMTRFDTDCSASLYDSSQSVVSEEFQPRQARKREYEPIIEENEEDQSPRPNGGNLRERDLRQLNEIIKDQIRNHYKEVELAWAQVDATNSNEMSKDMMWKLFKNLKVFPPISREEINLLWKEFILKDNKKLEYWQFIRHFGYSKRSAAYTNAKKAPPKKGDNDMMLTSNKLGRDSILIRGSVQSKLFLMFDILKRSYMEIDPYYTNYCLRDEFEEILRELCPELNDEEMEYICSKHENPRDGRINYVEFLNPYCPRRIREKPDDSIRQPGEGQQSSRIDLDETLMLKLKNKLGDNLRQLRRIFKQHDYRQTGYVNISAFKDTLKSFKVNLNEEETISLLRRLDRDLSGLINYNRFINDIVKPLLN